MSRGLRWTIALAAGGLCSFTLVLGTNLLPSWMAAATRGITPQLVLTWLLIAATCGAALILMAFLIAPISHRR